MILLIVIVVIVARLYACRVQIRRIAVNQLAARERMLGQISMGTAVEQLDRVTASEFRQRARIVINADVVACRQTRLDAGVARRHRGDQRVV